MADFDLLSWAVKGAELRLVEIAEEAKAIFAAFQNCARQAEASRLGRQPVRMIAGGLEHALM